MSILVNFWLNVTWISVMDDKVKEEDNSDGDESHWPADQKHSHHTQSSCE